MSDGGLIALIDNALSRYIRDCGAPEELKESMAYSLLGSGKRLRPRLCLEVCGMLDGMLEAALPIACALEMIHCYSLIHDDLPCMDDDDMRRGRPSNHKMFGEANAVLAGDGLMSLAFETMLIDKPKYDCFAPRYYEAAAAVARGAGVSGMVAGQILDMKYTGLGGGDMSALEAIHTKKTGALIHAAAVSGAVVADAGEKELDAVSRFAKNFGLLFQITDDILDASGSQGDMGKTLGKDETERKLTYVTLMGLDEARRMAAETAGAAKEPLEMFGAKARGLMTLVDDTLKRTK